MNKFWKITPEEVTNIVEEKVLSLKSKDYQFLQGLPERNDETIAINGQDINCCTYKETLSNGDIGIIVQGYRHRFLGIGTMVAKSFSISANGAIGEVPTDKMYKYY